MTERDKKDTDQGQMDDVLKRMLNTPPPSKKKSEKKKKPAK